MQWSTPPGKSDYLISYHKIMDWKRLFFYWKYSDKTLHRRMLLWLAVLAWIPLLLADASSKEPRRVVGCAAPRQCLAKELPETEAAAEFDALTRVPVITNDGLCAMRLDEYLTGVLLAEMPVSFSPEALKAQAVAARTFAIKTCGSPAHNGAVCTDSTCCQAWTDPDRFGIDADVFEKVQLAVEETNGIVVTYRGELIDAVYFSCSGGKTEAAQDVWGADVAYLKSVASPGEEGAAHYNDTVVVSTEAFREIVLAEQPQTDLTGAPENWIGTAVYTEGGGIKSLEIGGRDFSGTDLRKIFGLRSTAFSVEVADESVIFETLGFGHRVGLSQYGAEAMACAGADFRQILRYYYSDVMLKELRK